MTLCINALRLIGASGTTYLALHAMVAFKSAAFGTMLAFAAGSIFLFFLTFSVTGLLQARRDRSKS